MSRITKHREHKKSTKALRKALDKTKGFVYNLLQTLLALVVAIPKKSKGVLRKIFARISRGVPAISQFFQRLERRPHMAISIRRAFGATLLSALAIALTACGGGGGSSTPTTPTPPAKTPVAGDFTMTQTPSNGATGVAVNVKPTITINVKAGTYASASSTETCAGQTVDAAFVAPTAFTGTIELALVNKANLPYATTCAWNGSVTVAGVDGGASSTQNFSLSFTTENWWPPKKVLELGVKGGDTPPQEVPMETNPTNTPAIGGSVWQENVANGKIQFVKTGMRLVGLDWATGDELNFAIFVDPLTKQQCMALVYAKNGTSVNPNPRTWGCKTEIFDNWWGNSAGLILHVPSRGECYQVAFDQVAKTTTETLVTCPKS